MTVNPTGLRVLIVEDNLADRRAITMLLEQAWPGTSPATDQADSVDAAKARLEMQAYDFILLDWRLTGQDGGALVSWLRERGDCTPCVVVSCWPQFLLSADLVQHRVEYLDKYDLNASSLRRAMDRAVRLSHSSDRVQAAVTDRRRP